MFVRVFITPCCSDVSPNAEQWSKGRRQGTQLVRVPRDLFTAIDALRLSVVGVTKKAAVFKTGAERKSRIGDETTIRCR